MSEPETTFEERVLAMLAKIDSDNENRLTILETHDKDISGNGRPGRMEKAEKRITALERLAYMLLGVAGVAGTIFELIRH